MIDRIRAAAQHHPDGVFQRVRAAAQHHPVVFFSAWVLIVPPIFGLLAPEDILPTQPFEFAFLGLLLAALLMAWLVGGRQRVAELCKGAVRWRLRWYWWAFGLLYFAVAGAGLLMDTVY